MKSWDDDFNGFDDYDSSSDSFGSSDDRSNDHSGSGSDNSALWWLMTQDEEDDDSSNSYNRYGSHGNSPGISTNYLDSSDDDDDSDEYGGFGYNYGGNSSDSDDDNYGSDDYHTSSFEDKEHDDFQDYLHNYSYNDDCHKTANSFNNHRYGAMPSSWSLDDDEDNDKRPHKKKEKYWLTDNDKDDNSFSRPDEDCLENEDDEENDEDDELGWLDDDDDFDEEDDNDDTNKLGYTVSLINASPKIRAEFHKIYDDWSKEYKTPGCTTWETKSYGERLIDFMESHINEINISIDKGLPLQLQYILPEDERSMNYGDDCPSPNVSFGDYLKIKSLCDICQNKKDNDTPEHEQ